MELLTEFEMGRLRYRREIDIHTGALGNLVMPTTGNDAASTLTFRTEGDFAGTSPPGLVVSTSAVNNSSATLHWPATNLAKTEVTRLRLLTGLTMSGGTRDVEFGFVNSLTAPTSGIILRQKGSESNANLVAFNAGGTAAETIMPTEYGWTGNTGVRVDLSLWIMPAEKRVYFGQAPLSIDKIWEPGSAFHNSSAALPSNTTAWFPYLRCTTRTAAAKAFVVHQLQLDTWYL